MDSSSRSTRTEPRRIARRVALGVVLGVATLGSVAALAQSGPGLPGGGGTQPGVSQVAPLLTNGVAAMHFRLDANGTDLWPSSLTTLATARTVRFANEAKATPIVEVELRQAGDDATRAIVHPSDLGAPALTLDAFAAGTLPWSPLSGRRLVARWEGTVAEPGGPGTIDVRVELEWVLFRGADTVEARVSDARILNDAQTSYRLWVVRFPRLEIGSLATTSARDFLATGKFGGFVYESPIDYVDPATGSSYVFTLFPGNDADVGNAWPISIDAAEPGPIAVPVSAYWEDATETCFYQANDDGSAHLKGLYFQPRPDPVVPSLFSETVQFPPGDGFDVTQYVSPYRAHLAAIVGDWADAAFRYRRVYRGFRWYPGPTGATSNLEIPAGMKTEPTFAFVSSGNGYEPWTYNLRRTFRNAAFWSQWLQTTFPFLVLNRFAVDPPVEITIGGYTPDPNLDMVHRVTAAEQAGHRVAFHGLTEKLSLLSSGFICQLFPGYCAGFDPAILAMNQENAVTLSVGGPAIGFPCPRGKGATQPDWPTWWTQTAVDVANTLGTTGGQGWPAPTVSVGWDFRQDHDHDDTGATPPGEDPPGFGDWYASGWMRVARDIRSQVDLSGPNDAFPTMIELSGATLSPGAPLQNDVAFDISVDFNHMSPSPLDLTPWFDAPIRSVPMLQMVADNVRIVSTYGPKTTALPYTAYHSLPSGGPQPPDAVQYFRSFPAVSGALSAWSMSERVLARQGTLVLNDEMHVPHEDVVSNDPNLNLHQKAAQDLFRFYRGLHAFLTASNLQSVPLMRFHAGTLERPIDVAITNATESWVLAGTTIAQYFPQLATAMSPSVWNYPAADLDWSRYRPGNTHLGLAITYSHIWFPSTPSDRQSWLPHGVYRDAGGTKLALLLANPWGVQHADGLGLSRPMNPFTFDYADPSGSPPTGYAYQFTFDPADYPGHPASYQYWFEVFDVSGTRIAQSTPQSTTGPVTLTGSLQPFEYGAWFFQ